MTQGVGFPFSGVLLSLGFWSTEVSMLPLHALVTMMSVLPRGPEGMGPRALG